MYTITPALLSLAFIRVIAAASPVTHQVQVGNGGIQFNPDHMPADVGDSVRFHFFPSAHSVARGVYDKPCTPFDNGFYSGFQTVTDGKSNLTFTVTVNDTNPIWVYCSQVGHCQGGMAMVINQRTGNASETLDAYKTAAKDAQTQSPAGVAGGVFSEDSNDSSASSSSASGSTTATSTSAISGSPTPSSTVSSTGTITGSATASSTSKSDASIEKIVGRRYIVGAGLFALMFAGLLK